MLLKIAALGALAYAGYRYAQGNSTTPEVRLAGGPLSKHAKVQHSADEPPERSPYPG